MQDHDLHAMAQSALMLVEDPGATYAQLRTALLELAQAIVDQ